MNLWYWMTIWQIFNIEIIYTRNKLPNKPLKCSFQRLNWEIEKINQYIEIFYYQYDNI